VPETFTSTQQKALDSNETLVKLLKDGGGIKDASAYSPAKMLLLRWHKIAINASMNPSAVLSGGTPNGAMANDPELAIHLKGVMDEVLETAPRIVGSPFPADFASSETLIKSTQKNTSGSKPSMLLDWEEDKTMELEVILGNPIRIAREQGYEMPRMQTLYALLKMAQANRDKLKRASKL
jgi:2-dehydropantoate 2-reductase